VVALIEGAIRKKAETKFQNFQKTLARLKKLYYPLRETRRHCESNETKKDKNTF
jgi:hypothetical protein